MWTHQGIFSNDLTIQHCGVFLVPDFRPVSSPGDPQNTTSPGSPPISVSGLPQDLLDIVPVFIVAHLMLMLEQIHCQGFLKFNSCAPLNTSATKGWKRNHLGFATLRCLEEVPKNIIPNGGGWMVFYHGTIRKKKSATKPDRSHWNSHGAWIFSLPAKKDMHLPSLKLTVRAWTWMVGRFRSFPFGFRPIFRGYALLLISGRV